MAVWHVEPVEAEYPQHLDLYPDFLVSNFSLSLHMEFLSGNN
jgi:hypothetical protein